MLKGLLSLLFLLLGFVYYVIVYFYHQLRKPYEDIRGMVVLVTGAASGVGKETVLLLASKNCFVYATDKNENTLRELDDLQYTNIKTFVMDVADPQSVQDVFQKVTEDGRSVDTLVSNAGIGGLGPLVEMGEEEMNKLTSVNALGAYRLVKTFFPMLCQAKFTSSGQRRRSKVVVVTSGSAHAIFPFQGAFAMSKAALEAYCDALRLELLPYDIQVSVIIPTAIETPHWNSESMNGYRNGYRNGYHSMFAERLHKAEAFFKTIQKTALPPIKIAEKILEVISLVRPSSRYIVDAHPFLVRLFFNIPDWLKDYVFLKLLDKSQTNE